MRMRIPILKMKRMRWNNLISPGGLNPLFKVLIGLWVLTSIANSTF